MTDTPVSEAPKEAPKAEFTDAYAKDVKARFEHLEKHVRELNEFSTQLGHSPSK